MPANYGRGSGLTSSNLGYTEQQALTTGIGTHARDSVSSVATMSTQLMRIGYFTAPKTFAVTNVRLFTGSTSPGVPTLVRFGLYSIAANGDMDSLLASTANDTTLLNAASTVYTKALQAGYTLVAGTRYAAGLLVVTSNTAPNVAAVPYGSTSITLTPRTCAQRASQSDLPASITDANQALSSVAPYFEFT